MIAGTIMQYIIIGAFLYMLWTIAEHIKSVARELQLIRTIAMARDASKPDALRE